ncbi:hypothetical protein ZWY2020_055886 [Hordeum vulgare]|nr:hypothetical protein ZWY2020_055886 [Hordeum vulgare]
MPASAADDSWFKNVAVIAHSSIPDPAIHPRAPAFLPSVITATSPSTAPPPRSHLPSLFPPARPDPRSRSATRRPAHASTRAPAGSAAEATPTAPSRQGQIPCAPAGLDLRDPARRSHLPRGVRRESLHVTAIE